MQERQNQFIPGAPMVQPGLPWPWQRWLLPSFKKYGKWWKRAGARSHGAYRSSSLVRGGLEGTREHLTRVACQQKSANVQGG